MKHPHLRTDNRYFSLPEFLKFSLTTEHSILMFLLSKITRDVSGHNAPTGAWRIYNDFFKKGLLCASYSQDAIASYFGFIKNNGNPNGAYISRLIKKLEQLGLLKIHKIKTPGGLRNVYELGQHNGNYGKEGYNEDLYFDLIFSAKIDIYKFEKEKERQEQTIERNIPEIIDLLNQKAERLKDELVELNDRVVDSFR